MIGLGFSSVAIQKQRWWPEGAIFAADFLNDRYMRDAAEIDFASAFAFERAGPATMQNGMGGRMTFPAAMPRIMPRIGALMEPGAVNLSRNTEDIGNAAGWSEGHLSFLDITGNGEAGFKIATKSAETGVFRIIEQYGYFSIPANEWGYLSFDLHDSGMRGAAIWLSGVGYWADFDTATGVANGQASGGNGESQASMESIGAGWWRCRLRVRQVNAPIIAWRIKLGKSRAATNYIAGDFIRIRAPQIELDRFSSYVPNTSGSASVTRLADIISPILSQQEYTAILTYTDGAEQPVAWTGGNQINAAALNGRLLARMMVLPE